MRHWMRHSWERLNTARGWRILFLATSLWILLIASRSKPMLPGDAHEYCATLQALYDHQTPDIRNEDLDRLGDSLRSSHLQSAEFERRVGTVRTSHGTDYVGHFWAYPLIVLPAKAILRLFHGQELEAFHLTNLALTSLALYGVLFGLPWPVPRRLWFVGLATLTPMLWYLRWPHAEVFAWSCVVICVVFMERRAPAAAALAAAVGAVQNPPLLFLALYAVACSLERPLHVGKLLSAMAGASVSLIPIVFYLWTFGTPSLLAHIGATNIRLLSAHRIWSFACDLNQGMLPYVPGLVVLGGVAAVRLLARGVRERRWREAALVPTMLLMIASCCVTNNWNAGAASIQRYAIWMLPLFAWLIMIAAPLRSYSVAWAGAVAIQTVIALGGSSDMFYVEHTRLAQFVLSHAPSFYDPEPDIFVERILHAEVPVDDRWPVAFVAPGSREVTKILTNLTGLGRLGRLFVVNDPWLGRVRRFHADRVGQFYVEPPAGTVVVPADWRQLPRYAAPCRGYGPTSMLINGCLTAQPDGTLLGEHCPWDILVYGPHVDVAADANVNVSFEILSDAELTVNSDIVSDTAKQFHGAVLEQRLGPAESRRFEYRVHFFQGTAAVAARIAVRGDRTAKFDISDLCVTVQ